MNQQLSSLMDLIKNKIEEIEKIEYKDAKKSEFFNDFFTKYSTKHIDKLFEMKISDLIMAIILSNYKECDFNQLESEIEQAKELLEIISGDMLEQMVEEASMIEESELDRLERIQKYEGESRLVKRVLNIKKIDSNIVSTASFLEIVKQISSLLKLLKKLPSTDENLLLPLIIHMKEEEDHIKNFLAMMDANAKLKKSTLQYNRKKWNMERIEEEFESMINYYFLLKKEQSELNKSKRKRKNNYVKLQTLLINESSKKEITKIDQILDMIDDNEIYEKTLEYIDEHNKKYYQKLEQEYLFLCENSYLNYIKLFEKYGICFQALLETTQESLMSKEVSVLEEKLKHLITLNLPQAQMVQLLLVSNMIAVTTISSYLRKGYVSKNWIRDHLELYEDESVLKKLTMNIERLLSLKINLKNLTDYECLLIDPEQIKANIKILEKYQISLSGKKLESLKMLQETDLEEKISSFIEVGLSALLLEDTSILNADKNLAKRVLLSAELNDEITENHELKQYIREKEQFYIPDRQINEYLLDRDNRQYQNSQIIELKGLKSNVHYLQLEDIIIPTGRIKNLKVSLEDIIKPSLYNRTQIQVLETYAKKVRK
ncbi:MAG: hypothetical protein PUB18_05895 [bacterium]|nr:hypothetical protein [bacterium]